MGSNLDDRWRPPAEARPAIRAVALELLEVMRPAAQACGYALAVHGSLERDLDVIAAPWTDEAVSDRGLLRRMANALSEARGHKWLFRGAPEVKPHGRLAYLLISPSDGISSRAGRHPFIDLSVMPRLVLPAPIASIADAHEVAYGKGANGC